MNNSLERINNRFQLAKKKELMGGDVIKMAVTGVFSTILPSKNIDLGNYSQMRVLLWKSGESSIEVLAHCSANNIQDWTH